MTITQARARAYAFALVDLIETKARALMARDPRLTLVRATAQAIAEMAGDA